MVHPASMVAVESIFVEHVGELEVVVPAVRRETVPCDQLTFGHRNTHSYSGL